MVTHIFSILCKNEPGVMMRITQAFTRRQVNMDSITVGLEPTGNARIITLFDADDRMAKFLEEVLKRLTQVINVEALKEQTSIVREIALLKTKSLQGEEKERTLRRIDEIGGSVLEVKGDAVIAEIHGDHERLESIIQDLGSDVLKEVARSGQVYVSREFE